MRPAMLRAARASEVPAIVRCLAHDLARTLDLGADGVQIPIINNAQEAADLVQRVQFARRGLCRWLAQSPGVAPAMSMKYWHAYVSRQNLTLTHLQVHHDPIRAAPTH